jgi:hypothetical protein
MDPLAPAIGLERVSYREIELTSGNHKTNKYLKRSMTRLGNASLAGDQKRYEKLFEYFKKESISLRIYALRHVNPQ